MLRRTTFLFIWLLAACAADKSSIRVIDASAAVYEVPAAASGATVEPIAQRNGRGPLVLHGGGSFSRDTAAVIVALAGPDPHLCLIDTADDGRGQIYRLFDGFRDLRISVINLRPGDAALPDVVATLRSCTGYFFGGGAPQRLSLAFRPDGRDTPALAAIRERFERSGAVVAGSSAGAMVVGPVTLCECAEGSSVAAVTRGELIRAPGFDLLSAPILVDTHFFARGLLGRHMFALARDRLPVGVGIDEGTTVLVPGDGSAWQVLAGRSVAIVRTPADARTDRLHRFGLTLVYPRDHFDPVSNKIVAAADRRQDAADDILRNGPAAREIKYTFSDGLVSVDPL